jgi:glycosyltransferase involved in cell wall biosynthesis
MATLNRFCFLAIVRDESSVIERCLESVKNMATSYLVCDTGSKDDTVSKIETTMKSYKIPGEVISKKWSSYGEIKNYLWSVSLEHPLTRDAKYICWLNADEVFITDPKDYLSYPSKEVSKELYEYLEGRKENVFRLGERYNVVECQGCHIARNNQRYVWNLPYKEYLSGPSYSETYLDLLWVKVFHFPESPSSSYLSQKMERIRLKVDLILQWLDSNPKHQDVPRMTFYLAELYVNISPEAITFYKQVVASPLITQEKYIAILRLASLVEDMAYRLYLWIVAQQMFPKRLEAYYDMMMYYHNAGEHQRAAGVFYSATTTRTPPLDGLFIRRNIYDYLFDYNASVSFFNIGEYRKALEIGGELVSRGLYPSQIEKPLKAKIQTYEERCGGKVVIRPQISEPIPPTKDINVPLPLVVVIDNFYPDPVGMRDTALKMDFSTKGNYPGIRTEPTATETDKRRFEDIIGRKITGWPTLYNGSFQYTIRDQKSWVHRDLTDFSVVIYLTPNAPVNAGTVLYRHKKTGLERAQNKEEEDALRLDANDESLWEVIDRVGNKFNRAIIFQGFCSHKSDVYFGEDLQTGRLFQTFFFNVEGRKY